MIRSNRIIIIKGFTGCGKSTQIPQYLAVDCQNYGQAYNIIVTQPRRVAAKVLATRVASELNCPIGSLVGYQIGKSCARQFLNLFNFCTNLGLDRSRDNKATKILYVTTGVLLQRLIMSTSLNFVSHIILDEIHERSADMDMLFLIIKKKIFENKLNAKIILMSATCNVDLFQKYFTYPEYLLGSDTLVNISPAVFEIYGSRVGSSIQRFKQKFFYLENIVDKIGSLKFDYAENSNKYVDYEDFLQQNEDSKIIFNKDYPMLHKILYEVVLGILFHEIEIHQLGL